MQISPSHQTGTAGMKRVEAHFEVLGWGTIENDNHDAGVGIDLFLFARDEGLRDLGQVVTAQVKGGRSYFDEPVTDDGNVTGWIYREDDDKHLNYWLNQPLPHLIVLHAVDGNVSYWVHITPRAVERTGKGWKVLVPETQRVDEAGRPQLLQVASKSDIGAIALEGSAWEGLEALGSEDEWRCALVAPRLVAPHPNAGFEHSIGPAQALALIVQGRMHHYEEFAAS